MAVRRIHFLGLPLDVEADTQTVCDMLRDKKSPHFISFVNPSAWALAKKNSNYLGALNSMSVVLVDGEGVACACRVLLKEKCHRLSFDMSSLADSFFKTAQAEKSSLMLVGGEPGVSDNASAKLRAYYPFLDVAETMHGYGSIQDKIDRIMEKKPDVVIVGMGTPRQEMFLTALRAAGYKGFAITCGGFFDQYLKSQGDRYYPRWIDRWNLRFLYRLYKEPRRLWRRYLIDYQIFCGCALMALPHALFEKCFGQQEKRPRNAA
jgi:N-acetylglucosaminyldiphosphoundecaprenol N-acetyl-beta-D-mannosaminyltransferase